MVKTIHGIAVVAGEARPLAQRSAAASQEEQANRLEQAVTVFRLSGRSQQRTNGLPESITRTFALPMGSGTKKKQPTASQPKSRPAGQVQTTDDEWDEF